MGEQRDGPSAAEDALGRLADELARLLDVGEEPELAALAEAFGVSEAQAADCLRAVSLARGASGAGEAQQAPAAPTLPEDYELMGELGQGGMGIVYRARQRSLGREVAVKVLRPGEQLFGEAIRRFRREARSLARLRHANIVAVHEVGEVDGAVFYSMDLIEGGSLADRLTGEPLSPSFAVKVLKQVAGAIAYTHSKGIVHRDLKPANVLLDEEDSAFVADFGLARELVGRGDLTHSGAIVGTPDYMSPEQARGDVEAVGESTDVYSLGVMLYECLTGRPPFAGLGLVERIHAVVHTEPSPPRRAGSPRRARCRRRRGARPRCRRTRARGPRTRRRRSASRARRRRCARARSSSRTGTRARPRRRARTGSATARTRRRPCRPRSARARGGTA